MAKFQIGARIYSSKEKATIAVRAVRDKYRCGETVADPEDARFLYDLLCMHPHAEQKIGPGVQSFSVEQNQHGTSGFWLLRVDGSRTDWSFVVCLTPPTHRKEVLSGLRAAIQDQIWAFRDFCFLRAFEIPCAVTQEQITRETAHVDHEIPFADLVECWFSETHLTFADVPVNPTTDGSTETTLADPLHVLSWQTFHSKHARLRMVSAKANTGLLRRRT